MPPRALSGSLYVFPSDLVDDGIERVAATARAAGLDTIALAMAYHQARDVVPHPRGPRVRYRRDGVFFHPTPSIWADSPMRPALQSAEEIRAVDDLTGHSDRPRIEAWTVFLHNMGLGEEHPSAATRNCFGDLLLSNLCPAAPRSRKYALALADDLASQGYDILAEALSQQGFGHGHHHERSFAPIGPGDEALLSLCFCSSCAAAALNAGVDVVRLAARCRARVDSAWAGASGLSATRDALADAVGADVLALLTVREEAVTTLATAVAERVHERGRRLIFMDLTGALLGYDDGIPAGESAADQAWRLSIDPTSVARVVDEYAILGYARDPERLAADVASVRVSIGETPLRVTMRPGWPDTAGPEHWAQKKAAATAAGADRVDVYNYGMAPEHILEGLSPSAV